MRDYIRNQRGRMFDNDVLELFSKVHPSMPFIFWIPVVGWVTFSRLADGTTTLPLTALFLAVGFVVWQFMEYFIHMKVFHLWPAATGHGFHHKYPDDDTRLVMPLPVSITLASLIYFGLALFGHLEVTVPLWAGIVVGYLWYDFLHWSTHHRAPLTEWGKKLRAHHMAHHFGDPDKNFGISHMWLDRRLGTLQDRGTR